MLYRPQDIAAKLGIAPSTLRLWSSNFAAHLSSPARKNAGNGGAPWAQRRYTEEDLDVLLQVKGLMTQGYTYLEARQRLSALPASAEGQRPNDGPSSPRPLTDPALKSLVPLQEALTSKDKTIAALRESLKFMDAYLQAVRQEREESRERGRRLERELEEIRSRRYARQVPRPWWKQLLGLP